jgi:hypothetical protein
MIMSKNFMKDRGQTKYEPYVKAEATPLPTTVLMTRPLIASDTNFILNSWMRSHRNCEGNWAIPHQTYFRCKELQIRKWLSNPLRKVLLAVDKEDHDHILGYIIYSQELGGFVDYLYVKDVFRGYGIANLLVNATGLRKDGLQITHMSPAVKSYMEKNKPQKQCGPEDHPHFFRFNPFLSGI